MSQQYFPERARMHQCLSGSVIDYSAATASHSMFSHGIKGRHARHAAIGLRRLAKLPSLAIDEELGADSPDTFE
jgi:hypothetical protein